MVAECGPSQPSSSNAIVLGLGVGIFLWSSSTNLAAGVSNIVSHTLHLKDVTSIFVKDNYHNIYFCSCSTITEIFAVLARSWSGVSIT